MSIALIVHGGAKSWPPEKREPAKQGCLNAVRVGWKLLEEGGSALDAVEAAIRVLEDDPVFNAGYGSVLNADGKARMDAGIMDGSRRRVGRSRRYRRRSASHFRSASCAGTAARSDCRAVCAAVRGAKRRGTL